MLISNDITNTAAVDAEHAHNSVVFDLLTKFLGGLSVLNNKLTELGRLRLAFFVSELGNDLVRVELVLVLVDLESLDVLLERLNALVDLRLETLVLLVDPGVLVWQLLFVFHIWCFWHRLGLDGHLQVHFLVRLEKLRHQFLLELRNFLQVDKTVLKGLQDDEDDIIGLVAVDNFVILVEDQVDLEERELLLLGADSLDLLFRVVLVLDFTSAVDHSGDGKEVVDGIDVVLDRASGELHNSVLHEVFLLNEELLQFSDLVGLFVGLSEVEPTALTLSSLLVVLLDDLLDLGDPSLLEIVGALRNGGCLDLVEVVNGHRVVDVGVEHITLGDIVALLADLLLGADDLILDLEGLERVLREGFGERVAGRRDRDHSHVRGLSLLLGRGQHELTGDKVGALLVQMLVEDDVVHGLGEVGVDLVEQGGGVSRALTSQGLRVLGHGQNAVDLVVVDLRNLVLGHVLNVVVVLDESVSIDTVLIGAFKALNELLRLLLVKDDEDTCKAALQLGDFPDTLEALRLGQVLEETEGAPVAQLVLVLPQTVGTDTLKGDHALATAAKPVLGEAGVEVPVVEGLEWEPAAWDLVRVSELGS